MLKSLVKAAPGKVVISPQKADDKSKGGIILPEQAKEKPNWGKIVSVGDGVLECYRIGLTVLYSKYAGNEFEFNGQTYLVLKNEDILALME